MGEHFLFNEDLISWSVGWQEIIAADPSQRFHAVFADPPYGLSDFAKRCKDCFCRVLSKIEFPDFDKSNPETLQDSDFPLIFDSVADLWSFLGLRVDSGIRLPECPVDLQGQIQVRDVEIQNGNESSTRTSKRILPDIFESNSVEFFGDYILQLRHFGDFTRCDGSGGCSSLLQSGFLTAPVVIPLASGGNSFLRRGFSVPDFCKNVGLGNYPLSDAKSSTGVVTCGGAEYYPVVGFLNLGGSLEYLRPASGTIESQSAAEFACAELVRTDPTACSLSAEFEPRLVRLVSNPTDGASSCFIIVWVHNSISISNNNTVGGFMGKKWDGFSNPIEFQRQVTEWGRALIPLLFPGAIVLMFGGTRTWHRLAAGMEDAGFDLWDTCLYLYGSGFPKGQDISKLIDKNTGTEKVVGTKPDRWTGKGTSLNFANDRLQTECKVTEPGSELSASWSGHKTPALKPAYEPILCFRAPSDGKTYAELAMEYGSGAINVDGCRIGADVVGWGGAAAGGHTWNEQNSGLCKNGEARPVQGRYPANLILDQTSAALLDEQSGNRGGGYGTENHSESKGRYGNFSGATKGKQVGFGDSGGASRFFYTSKASKSEREAGLDELPTKAFAYSNGAKAAIARGEDYEAAEMGVNKVKQRKNTHPTVKPLSLCKYLATLILPPDCVQPRRLLIPFAGTGSEMIGALQAGWDEVYGIEREQEYIEIAEHRVEYWSNKLKE